MSVEMDVEIVKDAARRTRWVFAAITICALCQLALFYNFNFSWMQQYADASAWMGKADTPERKIHEKYVENWVDSTSVDVPIIGVQASVADTAVFGSLSMMILSVWLFFASRRENHLIRLVLTDARDSSLDAVAKHALLRGIVASQVLSPTTDNDNPLFDLDERHVSRRQKIPRGVNLVLRYLPCVVIVVGLILDWVSAVRGNFLAHSWLRISLMSSVAAVCAVICGQLAHRSRAFQHGTAALIRKFGAELDTQASLRVAKVSLESPSVSGERVAPAVARRE